MNGLMEIALLPKNGIKIKGKSATIAVDSPDKGSYQAVLVVDKLIENSVQEEHIVIVGPGEYEIAGVKITGLQMEKGMLYTLTVDGVRIALGKLSALTLSQSKLQEQDMVLVLCDVSESASFVTAIAAHVVLFYGEKAAEVAQTFGKEQVKSMTKYQTTKEKLPTEVETILLQ